MSAERIDAEQTSPLLDAVGGQVIGIDLGGTAIKFGRFDAAGQCLQSLTVPTPQPPDPEAVMGAIAQTLPQIDPEDQAIALGIGTPGPVDETGRIALVAINLGWRDVPLADWLEDHTGKPVIAANDANCAGLGEAWLGAGRRFKDLLLLTLGTGVGGAVILDGKLFVGRHGTGAELGLMTLDPSGETCNSGNHGSLEQLVSVQAVRRRMGMEPAELGERAAAGDAEAIAFWQTYGRDLGAGIANLVYIFTPEAVVLGGGISASAPHFMPSLWDEIEQRVLPTSREGLQILTAELGNQAGMVGAAKLAWQHVASLNAATVEAEQPSLEELQLAYGLAVQHACFNSGFLARTAHELRSPLNSIIGLHQLILNDLCDDPQEEREFVGQANQSAMKLLDLMDEIIRVSKVELGTLPLAIQPTEVATLLKTIHELTYLRAQDRNVRLTITIPDRDCWVQADPKILRQILVHRLNSALDDPAVSQIEVGTTPTETGLHFWIVDGRSADVWQEVAPEDLPRPITVPSKAQLRQTIPLPALSPGMLLHLDQLLLQRMGSRLEWTQDERDRLRLQWCLPFSTF